LFSWRAGGALPVPSQPARGQLLLVREGREALCVVLSRWRG